jgi:epoxyqueuosine reductase QueG
MVKSDESAAMSEDIRAFFNDLLESHNETGDIGFANFKAVYDSLMPVQQEKLKSITGDRFNLLMKEGSFVSIGIAYKTHHIGFIDSRHNDLVDYERWNKYALEYNRLNQVLNKMSKEIASQFDGIPLTATIGGIIDTINHVSEYFPMVVSHRAVAEHAGIGWRGKNHLLIHEKYSCAIRFASIIVPHKLDWGKLSDSKCGSCVACEDACTFIKNRAKLSDFRENCRRYILFLKSKGIEKDICGKCIKACLNYGIYSDEFELQD